MPYQRVIECCDAVLEFDATNAKALYRKASAKYSNKDYETALELFTEAQKQPDGLKGDLIISVSPWIIMRSHYRSSRLLLTI